MKERDVTFKNIAGSSAGALVALMVALNVKPEDLRKFFIACSSNEMGHVDDLADYIPWKDR